MLIVAVDIGGTFTDFLGYDTVSGKLLSSKAPTTPVGLEHGIHDCLKKAGVSVKAIGAFVHGSTIAINTVLERKGARTALIVTKGTRDVYKIGRGNRPDAYDIWFTRPEPLVPRHLTFEVEERLLATGEVHTRLNTAQAEIIARQVAATGAEAVAVCFLHSWNNPIHEQEMARLLNSKMYRSISHEILREYGEYERISTTVLNSYIGPKVSAYLEALERMLHEQGFAGRLTIMAGPRDSCAIRQTRIDVADFSARRRKESDGLGRRVSEDRAILRLAHDYPHNRLARAGSFRYIADNLLKV